MQVPTITFRKLAATLVAIALAAGILAPIAVSQHRPTVAAAAPRHSADGASRGSGEVLRQEIDKTKADLYSSLQELRQGGENISIEDMVQIQMDMNHLSQLTEMSSAVSRAVNSSMVRMVTR